MKTGVLLVNMGGALSQKGLKHFLYRMFTDPYILPLTKTKRKIIAYLISRTRYRSSWKKYKKIGGTPIIEAGKALAKALQTASGLGTEIAFSYSDPNIKEGVKRLLDKSVEKIVVIPLYPQKSITTSSSVEAEIELIKKEYPSVQFDFVSEFYHTEEFTDYWVALIKQHMEEEKIQAPVLLFAAHSLPMKVVNRGDTYPESIEKNAQAIAQKLDLNYQTSFQSKMGHGAWYGRDTEEVVKELVENGNRQIVLIPISFVSECLETIYDVDVDLFPRLRKALPPEVRLSRVRLPQAHPLFVKTLAALVR